MDPINHVRKKLILSFYRDSTRTWRWRVRGYNGRKVANAGEGYRRPGECRAIARKLFPYFFSGARA